MATGQRKAASKEELESLKDHFKHVGFQEYPLLNDDCKRHLIGCLDGRSLIRIGMCSKMEQRLTANVPWKIFLIGICDVGFTRGVEMSKWEKVFVSFDGSDGEYCVSFGQSENNVVVETPTGRLLWTHENSEHFKEAVLFFEFLLKKCNYGVKSIELKMGQEALQWAERDGSPVQSLPNLRHSVFWMDVNHQKLWLKKMPDHLESLSFDDEVTSEIIETPQFRNARNIICYGQCDVTDEQLLELNAVDFYITGAPLLTANGVNVFLKRWQYGGGVDGFRRLEFFRIGDDGDNVQVEDILEGLGLDAVNIEEEGLHYSIQNQERPNEHLDFVSDVSIIKAEVRREGCGPR